MGEVCSQGWMKLFSALNESQRRWAAAVKALEIGYGGISEVGRNTGLSRTTITQGIQEIQKSEPLQGSSVRQSGGGRKSLVSEYPGLKKALEDILEGSTAGDPISAITWTSKSMRKISAELKAKGYETSFMTVNNILHELGYSIQCNRKSLSRANNPDRDAQFKLINKTVEEFIVLGNPVISVDAKKKEQIGNFKNAGLTWRKKDMPRMVEDHDFHSNSKGVAIPYGAYDLRLNEGFVNVGVTSDTAEFAVNSIRQWWQMFGSSKYPEANQILICADGGGSNGSRSRLWKYYLQKFANETNLTIYIKHYPPGTSKWNKIEHRMFSYISINWKGCPLESYEAVVNLISNTTTAKGLKIRAMLDENTYEKGKKVSDQEFNRIFIKHHDILPRWNYSIYSHT